MLHGVGRYEWPDGKVYHGDFKDNNKEGNGLFMWPDGKSYDGGWIDNKQDGEAKFTNKKG